MISAQYNDGEVTQPQDKLGVIDAVNSIFIGTDARDWARVRDAFTPEVLLDYSSMGSEAATLSPETVVANWQAVLPGFEATQHSISNHQVEVNGDGATCLSYGTALHYLPNDQGASVWRVVGTYRHHLVRTAEGWKVDQMTFTLKFMDGNTDLPALAQQRVSEGD